MYRNAMMKEIGDRDVSEKWELLVLDSQVGLPSSVSFLVSLLVKESKVT